MSTFPSAPKKSRRARRRYIIPLVLLSILFAAVIAAVVHGSWADRMPRDPKSPADGIICRLYQPPDGPWQVRCAMVLDYSPEKVWAVITDYDHFAEIFPTLESAEHERLEGGKVRLQGMARSALGNWPYDIEVSHEVEGERRHSHWEGESGDVQKLRGSWTVTPAGPGQTLLVYASHVEIKRYPDWVVVNAMFARQPKVMEAVADRLAQRN